MELKILGPLGAWSDGTPIALGGTKQRSVLAMLLLAANTTVSRQALVDGLWGEQPPPSAAASLDTYVSRLRRALADQDESDRLTTTPGGYRLRVDEGELDLQRLASLTARAGAARTAGDHDTAERLLHEAVGLFSGDPLEDLADAPFAVTERPRLEELRLRVTEERGDLLLAQGRHLELLPELRTLTDHHPFREAFWSQLMLALYRSGRSPEALRAYDRLRQQLAAELGIDPGPAIQDLHARMLRQDAGLSAGTATVGPATPTVGRVGATPRRRYRPLLTVGAALLLVAAGAAALRPGEDPPGAGQGEADAGPGVVVLDIESGRRVATIPGSSLAVAAYPLFADGRFWVNDFFPAGFIEIDPTSGRLGTRLTQPSADPDGGRDPSSLTPFAVGQGRLWVGSGHDLAVMDVTLGRIVDRWPLDDLAGRGLIEGVALGGGSLWVSRDVGRGQILRLDPDDGRLLQRFDGTAPHLQLSFGDGSLWAADASGVLRIDAATGTVTRVKGVLGVHTVVAGGGYGWVSDPRNGVVYRIDQEGRVSDAYRTGLGAAFMAFADGTLWVANREEGTLTSIDAVTGRTTTRDLGHPTETLAAGAGRLLVQLADDPTVEEVVDGLSGRSAVFFADAGQLGQGDEPALDTHPGALQVAHATCAHLVSRPHGDDPRAVGLEPEVATAMPVVSDGGRTFTFTVRPGFAFSPPSNQPLTAETYRYSIERALSPRLDDNPVGQVPPGPLLVDDIVGEAAFRAGRADHIAGLRASGDRLRITLRRPSADFLERLALPYFCPVPVGTPYVAGGPVVPKPGSTGQGVIVGSGPYYVSDYTNGVRVVLRRNPNYPEPDTRGFDSIAILEGAGAGIAAEWVESRGYDGITSMVDPALRPGGEMDRRWGPDGTSTDAHDPGFQLVELPAVRFLAFNTRRGAFADPGVRRAAGLALDRESLAAVRGEPSTAALLSSAFPRRDRRASPTSAALSRAKALMRGRTVTAVMVVSPACEACRRSAGLLRDQLDRVGIRLVVRRSASAAEIENADLLDLDVLVQYPDPARLLGWLGARVPQRWLPPGERAAIRSLARSSGGERTSAAVDTARFLVASGAVAPYATPSIGQLVGPDVGCRSFVPWANGLDLVAMCAAP